MSRLSGSRGQSVPSLRSRSQVRNPATGRTSPTVVRDSQPQRRTASTAGRAKACNVEAVRGSKGRTSSTPVKAFRSQGRNSSTAAEAFRPQGRNSSTSVVAKAREVEADLTEEAVRVLRAIRRAQDHGLRKDTKNDGRLRNIGPSYAVACEEIRKGHKSSHWIWYVWPSLQAVRGAMHPEFLLPDFKTACAYLRDPVLADRLLEVSSFAIQHLQAGTDPAVLFGKMHRCDFPKFYEAMTLFAIAAHVAGDADKEAKFLGGVRACGVEDLEPSTVDAVMHEGFPGIGLAVEQVAAALSSH